MPDEPPGSTRDRDERIAELEHQLLKRNPVGVMPPVAALALVGTLAVLALQKREVDYFFSERQPIDLGAEGDYHLDRAISDRYAEIHGTPTLRGVYGAERGSPWVVVGLVQTPVLVKRPTLPSEIWKEGNPPPQPDQRPFAVRGRLRSRVDAGRLGPAFDKMEELGELKPKWILEEGVRPGGSYLSLLVFGGLAAFGALNAWLLGRSTLSLLRRRK